METKNAENEDQICGDFEMVYKKSAVNYEQSSDEEKNELVIVSKEDDVKSDQEITWIMGDDSYCGCRIVNTE